MKKTGFLRRMIAAAFVTIALVSVFGNVAVYAQPEAAVPAPVWHKLGAALGLGLCVVGAGLGIGRFAAAAADGIARQPAAAAQISGAISLPLFLLEGVAVLAEVFILVMLFLK